VICRHPLVPYATIPVAGVTIASFSPQSTFLVAWKPRASVGPIRRQDGTIVEAPPSAPEEDGAAPAGGNTANHNLFVWRADSGEAVTSLAVRSSFSVDAWPLLRWTADEELCARMTADGVVVMDGALKSLEAVSRIACPGIESFSVSPSKLPYGFATFTPKTKSRPGAVAVYAFPKLSTPTCAKSLQADHARLEWSPDGCSLLVELSTDTSADSYYGDSHLFLMTRDGKFSAPVPLAKKGAIHDFAWMPREAAGAGAGAFVVIAGTTPPQATLHDKRGAPIFSFGTEGWNTVKFSPSGRFLLLGGFGNMPGDCFLWDMLKKGPGAREPAPLCPKFNSPCTTAVAWSSCGRYLLAATLQARLKVDNGVRVYHHSGTLVAAQSFPVLWQAQWRPIAEAAIVDRAASPAPKAMAPLATSASAAATPAAAAAAPLAVPSSTPWRPRFMQGSAGASAVAAIMGGDKKAAGKITSTVGMGSVGAQSGGPATAPARVPLGAAPGTVSSAAKKKQKKQEEQEKLDRDREEAEAKAALDAAKAKLNGTPVPAAASTSNAALKPEDEEELTKNLRKLEKKLRQISDLEKAQANGQDMNADQLAKLKGAQALRDSIKDLENRLKKL
jgi:translation initiation factor 2A